jgi:hypothetical protein
LDEYNDRCAEFAPGAADVETIVAVKTKCWDLLKACRNQYWDKQKDYGQVIPGESPGDTETSVLFRSLEWWSEPASLTLAPEMHFLIGSGIFWGFINSQRVDEETRPSLLSVSQSCFLLKMSVYRCRLASSYLENVADMQYFEATLELSILYKVLATWYHREGGKSVTRQCQARASLLSANMS